MRKNGFLIQFETADREQVSLVAATVDGRREALLRAFEEHPFTVPEPKVENTLVMRSSVDAYLIPDEVFETFGEDLKKELGKKREHVAGVLKHMAAEYEVIKLRDYLFTLPVKDAVKHTVEVDGENVNAVDYLAVKLMALYRRLTSDGYTARELFVEEKVELIN